jgi:hypothetical protein
MYNQTHPCIPGTGMKYAWLDAVCLNVTYN